MRCGVFVVKTAVTFVERVFFEYMLQFFLVRLERVLGLRKLVMKLVSAGRSSGNMYTDLLTGAGSSGNKGSMNVSVGSPQRKLRFIVITDRKCSGNFAKRKLPLECPVERLKNESLPVNRPAVSFKEQSLPVERATERIYVKTFRKNDSVDEKLRCCNCFKEESENKTEI